MLISYSNIPIDSFNFDETNPERFFNENALTLIDGGARDSFAGQIGTKDWTDEYFSTNYGPKALAMLPRTRALDPARRAAQFLLYNYLGFIPAKTTPQEVMNAWMLSAVTVTVGVDVYVYPTGSADLIPNY
ncbi:hypothetical protein J6590_077211 [Homalodisca vitripennis]|nr:hypothetical protein J6590_077211 [Homalodisca vitripennis]